MGVSESYEVPVPQVNPEPPKIDGVLDEPAWKQAVRLSGFYTFDLQRGAKPAHETAVLVLASPSALYFGFECAISNPKRLHITETRRDADVQRDERVVVLLDTLHSHERFYILNGQKFVPFAI